jgi:hypothetical protein
MKLIIIIIIIIIIISSSSSSSRSSGSSIGAVNLLQLLRRLFKCSPINTRSQWQILCVL